MINDKVKNLNHLFIFYKSFFVICTGVSVILALIIKSFFAEEKFYLYTFLENWQEKPIIDIKLIYDDSTAINKGLNFTGPRRNLTQYSPFSENNIADSKIKEHINKNEVECPEDFQLQSLATFPIKDPLCDCSESILYELSQGIIKPEKCSKFQYLLGCKDYNNLNSINLNSWRNYKICIKRHELNYLQINEKNFDIVFKYKNGREKYIESEIKNNINDIDKMNRDNIKQNPFSSIDINYYRDYLNNCSCLSKDSNFITICDRFCPIRNADFSSKFSLLNTAKSNISKDDHYLFQMRKRNITGNNYNFPEFWQGLVNESLVGYFDKNLKKDQNKMKKYQKNYLLNKENFTTYNDLEKIYLKNYKVKTNPNNNYLKSMAISDIIVADSFPCLIYENYRKLNSLYSLFNYFLKNFPFFKIIEQYEETKIEYKQNFTINKKFGDNNNNMSYTEFFESVAEEKCYFYQNSYYDKRLFTLDKMNYFEFLKTKLDDNDETYTNNNSQNILRTENKLKILSKNLNYTIVDNFNGSGFKVMENASNFNRPVIFHKGKNTNQNFIYLISKPFFGWNRYFCQENPQDRLDYIFKLYNKSSVRIDMLIIVKASCFAYILYVIMMQKLKMDFENGFYTGTNNLSRKIFIICDFIFMFINIMNLLNLVYLIIDIRSINKNNYLDIIRRNCFDDNSTRIFGYLSDSCEESIIYAFLISSITIVDIILFSIFMAKTYSVKIAMLNHKLDQ